MYTVWWFMYTVVMCIPMSVWIMPLCTLIPVSLLALVDTQSFLLSYYLATPLTLAAIVCLFVCLSAYISLFLSVDMRKCRRTASTWLEG